MLIKISLELSPVLPCLAFTRSHLKIMVPQKTVEIL